MKGRLVASVAMFLVVGCAGVGANSRQGSLGLARYHAPLEQDDETRCAYEMPTGSHVRRPVCRGTQEADAKRFATQDSLRLLRSRSMGHGGTSSVDDFDMVVEHVHVP